MEEEQGGGGSNPVECDTFIPLLERGRDGFKESQVGLFLPKVQIEIQIQEFLCRSHHLLRADPTALILSKLVLMAFSKIYPNLTLFLEIKFAFHSPQNFCFMYATVAPTTFIPESFVL